jgi:hypothetical protein
LRVEFEASGSKHFARKTSPNLLTRNSTDSKQRQRKESVVITLFIFQRRVTASWKRTNPVQRLRRVIAASTELFELGNFGLNY